MAPSAVIFARAQGLDCAAGDVVGETGRDRLAYAMVPQDAP